MQARWCTTVTVDLQHYTLDLCVAHTVRNLRILDKRVAIPSLVLHDVIVRQRFA